MARAGGRVARVLVFRPRPQAAAAKPAAVRNWILLLAGAGIITANAPSAGPRPAAKTHSVTIEGAHFDPPALVVGRGDRIVWVNKDLFPHTATAANKAFDSGSISPGGSWAYVARQSGNYPYECAFHPTMRGTLTVQ